MKIGINEYVFMNKIQKRYTNFEDLHNLLMSRYSLKEKAAGNIIMPVLPS